MSRNRRIALDHAAGVPATVLAEREQLALSRVYQIINKVCESVGLTVKTATKEELGVRLARCRYRPIRNSPEDFYWANLASREIYYE